MLIFIKNTDINAEIDLPLSKSESNRALMILYYSKNLETWKPENLEISDSDDTVLLQHLLNEINEQSLLPVDGCPLTVELDCANAGTVFRFLLTAVANLQLCVDNGISDSNYIRFLLAGSERMKSRPIDSLVDALRSLGVSIEYTEREGYPPVLLTVMLNVQQSTANSNLSTSDSQFTIHNSVKVSAEQSSQFASSLLLAAPLWENGLELHLTGKLSSLPYIDMTINMMRNCGIDVERNNRTIAVKPGAYIIENLTIEPDWSAAAFWYEVVALSKDNGQQSTEILLKNLNINSLQGDAVVMKMFADLGVETMSSDGGVVIKRSAVSCQSSIQQPTFNFTNCPDLFPAVISACAGLGIDATFTGLKNLSIKESDRKQAMINELKKINISFDDVSDDILKMKCPESFPYFTEEKPINFDNYGDHRIAMALSILSLKIGTIEMENPDVVSKSYPGFFRDLSEFNPM